MKTKPKDVPSIAELKKICQRFYQDPKGPLSEAFSRHTYLKVSIYVSWLFLHTNISPNQVTFISLITGLTGCYFLTLPGWYPIIGVILFNLAYIFDIVDGDIARFRKICSLSGAFFDRLTTAIFDPLMYAALAYGVYLKLGAFPVLAFGFSAAISLLLFKTVNGYLHIAVLEPIMHKKHTEMFQLEKTSQKADGVVSTFFEYRSTTPFLRYSEFVLGFGLSIALYCAVLLDSTLSLTFTFMSITLNLSYLYLIVTGICLPIVWIVSAAYIIKNKMPEQLYSKFFSKEQ